MVLAQPIMGASGNILMGPGGLLKTQMAGRLSSWGVHTLWIESEVTETPLETVISNESQLLLAAIESRFQGKLVNEPMQILHRAIVKHSGAPHVE